MGWDACGTDVSEQLNAERRNRLERRHVKEVLESSRKQQAEIELDELEDAKMMARAIALSLK